MEQITNDYEDHPKQHENSHKLCSEIRHPVLRLLESQSKLREHDQSF